MHNFSPNGQIFFIDWKILELFCSSRILICNKLRLSIFRLEWRNWFCSVKLLSSQSCFLLHLQLLWVWIEWLNGMMNLSVSHIICRPPLCGPCAGINGFGGTKLDLFWLEEVIWPLLLTLSFLDTKARNEDCRIGWIVKLLDLYQLFNIVAFGSSHTTNLLIEKYFSIRTISNNDLAMPSPSNSSYWATHVNCFDF